MSHIRINIRKNVVLCIVVTLLCEMFSRSTCNAAILEYNLSNSDDSVKMLKASELLLEFEECSKQVKQIKENYSLKNIEAKIAEQTKSQAAISVAKISGSISTYNKLKNELESTISALQNEYKTYVLSEECDESVVLQYESAIQEYQSQLDTVIQQLSSLDESYSSANTQYYSYVLESNLSQFYITNRELCEQEEINQVEYDFYDSLLSLVVLNEQEEYYDCYKTYLETQEKVEKIKLKNGLSTMLNVSDIQSKVIENDSTRNELEASCQSMFTMIYDEIEQENFSIVIDLDTSMKNFDSTKIIEDILKENTSYLKLKDMITVYKNYLVSGAYITLLQQQQINELVSSYETQKILLEKSIKRYVESTLKAYEQSVINLNATENSGNVLKQQYKVVQEQYKQGRATLLDVESMELKLSENEADYYQVLIKKMKLEYILEHSLYGITVE